MKGRSRRHRGNDREEAIEAGDLENPADVWIRYDRDQLTSRPVEVLSCAEKDMEHGRIDELRLGEVDDELRRARRKRRRERALELGRRIEVDLAADSND